MKKLIAIILILCTLYLSSCGLFTKGITVEQGDEYTKIVLDNFKGKKKIEIAHENPNEGALYYKTNLTGGSVKASYDLGLLWDAENLFEVSPDANSIGGGYYIDNNTNKITIIIVSDSGATGEILIGFNPFE